MSRHNGEAVRVIKKPSGSYSERLLFLLCFCSWHTTSHFIIFFWKDFPPGLQEPVSIRSLCRKKTCWRVKGRGIDLHPGWRSVFHGGLPCGGRSSRFDWILLRRGSWTSRHATVRGLPMKGFGRTVRFWLRCPWAPWPGRRFSRSVPAAGSTSVHWPVSLVSSSLPMNWVCFYGLRAVVKLIK